ncbi:MAG: chemotaxis protein CheB [Candidatus Binataceae bacterium]
MALASDQPRATLKHDIYVIGASRGGVEALRTIVSGLPAELPAAIFIVLHVAPGSVSEMPGILSRSGPIAASHPIDGESISRSHIYVAPPNYHMTMRDNQVHLDQGPKEHFTRPAADPLFRSAAAAYGSRVAGIVLTGGDGDGSEGLTAIKEAGGMSVVQDPGEARDPSMPMSGLIHDDPDFCLKISEIAPFIVRQSRFREAG